MAAAQNNWCDAALAGEIYRSAIGGILTLGAARFAPCRDGESAFGVSGMGQRAAAHGHTRHGEATWLDGRGVCALSAPYQRQYRAPRAAGWIREFRDGAGAR